LGLMAGDEGVGSTIGVVLSRRTSRRYLQVELRGGDVFRIAQTVLLW
jgi:hypothetical protein